VCTSHFSRHFETRCCLCAAAFSRCAARALSPCFAPAADPPKGAETWTATEGGFSCALDLVRHIRANYGSHFCVSVAGYPEGHPNVIKKVEAGRELTASERKRLITEEDGQYVCSDEVRSDGRRSGCSSLIRTRMTSPAHRAALAADAPALFGFGGCFAGRSCQGADA